MLYRPRHTDLIMAYRDSPPHGRRQAALAAGGLGTRGFVHFFLHYSSLYSRLEPADYIWRNGRPFGRPSIRHDASLSPGPGLTVTIPWRPVICSDRGSAALSGEPHHGGPHPGPGPVLIMMATCDTRRRRGGTQPAAGGALRRHRRNLWRHHRTR